MRILVMSILLAGLLASCRKNDDTAEPNDGKLHNIADKVNAYLEKEKKKTNAAGYSRITALQQNLDFGSHYSSGFDNEEYVCIIPLKAAFASKNNTERNALSQLVLFINKAADTIRKGNIVQVIREAPLRNGELKEFFSGYYAYGINKLTGSLAYNTVADEMVYELSYKEGNPDYYKSVGKKNARGRNATCFEIGWYYFWADGSVTWESIGEYCDGCEPVRTHHGKTYRVNCAGGGGGGVGNEDEGSPTKLRTWLVYTRNMYGPPIELYARIQMWGKKDSNYPQGGYFYRTSDQGSYDNNFSMYGAKLEDAYSQTWHGPQHAYQSYQAEVNFHVNNLPNDIINETKVYQFAEVFP